MAAASIVTGILVVVIIFAVVFATYKTFKTDDCCCKDNNCISDTTQHCDIRKCKKD